MHHPNERTLAILADVLAKTHECNTDEHTASMVGQVVWGYRDWLSGRWVPTPTRAADYFAESVFTARHHLREAGLGDLAAVLVATDLEHLPAIRAGETN